MRDSPVLLCFNLSSKKPNKLLSAGAYADANLDFDGNNWTIYPVFKQDRTELKRLIESGDGSILSETDEEVRSRFLTLENFRFIRLKAVTER